MGALFGTDGIRGLANKYPMTAEMAVKVGRAVAHKFKTPGHTPRIIIGKDTRISGDMLESAIVAGLCSAGADALIAGVIPTPGVAFLASAMQADAGIVISASHNPWEDNGIKIFGGKGLKLSEKTETEIEDLIASGNDVPTPGNPSDVGRSAVLSDGEARYVAFLKQAFPQTADMRGSKLAIDCGHGATYRVAPQTFCELGAEVVTLFNAPDGRNINADCGSQHPEMLAKTVVEQGCEAGFAFDGDGDRMIAVDEKGGVLTGDQLLAVCAASMKKEGCLKGNLVVRTVMSNVGLTVALGELGIDSVMTAVGDRAVLEEMLARGAVIGGEDSGHIIFLEHHTTGDGIITALQALAAMKKENKPLSELARIMEVYPQSLINVEVRKREEISSVPEIVSAIRNAEEGLGKEGRVLVRYSGTQNICRIMVEGPTMEKTEQFCRQISAVVQKALG